VRRVECVLREDDEHDDLPVPQLTRGVLGDIDGERAGEPAKAGDER
jgi:hypothetical protein